MRTRKDESLGTRVTVAGEVGLAVGSGTDVVGRVVARVVAAFGGVRQHGSVGGVGRLRGVDHTVAEEVVGAIAAGQEWTIVRMQAGCALSIPTLVTHILGHCLHIQELFTGRRQQGIEGTASKTSDLQARIEIPSQSLG